MSTSPAFTPDGIRLFYTAGDDAGRMRIVSATLDGTDVRPLPESKDGDDLPSVSPDGKLVAFTRGDPQQIWIVNLNGTGLRQLTKAPGGNAGPSFSPDGAAIVFESNRGGRWQVFAMKPDASGQHCLVSSDGQERLPRFAPRASGQ